MPIPVSCSCGKSFRVTDEYAGKRAKCPACGTGLTVPKAEAFDDFEMVEDEEPVAANAPVKAEVA